MHESISDVISLFELMVIGSAVELIVDIGNVQYDSADSSSMSQAHFLNRDKYLAPDSDVIRLKTDAQAAPPEMTTKEMRA